MEYLEYNQCFGEYALPDVVPLNSGENASNYKVNEYVAEGGTSQITIHPLQCTFILHIINSKR